MLTTGIYGGNYVMITWLPTYLKMSLHLSVINAGGYLALNIFGSFCGAFVNGYLADAVGRRKTFMICACLQAISVAVYTMGHITAFVTFLLGFILGVLQSGTAAGTGAFLAPAVGSNVQATLMIQSALTFNADATYTYTFRKNRNGTRTDQVIANGVTINSGAMIALSGHTSVPLRQGLVLTLISNTSASPISGTFSNLPDGGIVTVNGNNLQASYSGGDGNDLMLTVVP